MARLYHHSGLRQTEIADRLRISQTRVSRLLQQAEADGIVQTVVVPLIGLNSEIEEELEARYSLAEVHVIEAVSDDEAELSAELGAAAAAIFATMPVDMPVVGRHLVEPHAPSHDRRDATGAHRHRHGRGDAGGPGAARTSSTRRPARRSTSPR